MACRIILEFQSLIPYSELLSQCVKQFVAGRRIWRFWKFKKVQWASPVLSLSQNILAIAYNICQHDSQIDMLPCLLSASGAGHGDNGYHDDKAVWAFFLDAAMKIL